MHDHVHSNDHPSSLDFVDSSVAWTTIDDRVMGGASRSRMTLDGDGARFEGDLVVEGGGFASVRCVLPGNARASLQGASGLVLTCSGDGRRGYKVTLKTDADWDGVSYQCGFEANGRAQVRLPFDAVSQNIYDGILSTFADSKKMDQKKQTEVCSRGSTFSAF